MSILAVIFSWKKTPTVFW